MRPEILGIKKGMTQIFSPDGSRIPVTVIEAGPVYVLQVKTADGKDGYDAIQVGFGERREKLTSKPMAGHFQKSSVTPKRFVREFRTADAAAFTQGQEITVESFQGVSMVDVQGTSKGKGFQGTIKRWNFARQRMSHGNSVSHRAPGGIGRTYGTAKGVPKGKKMSGHMGDEIVTIRGLDLVKVDPERNLLLVKGSVPGANGGMVVIRKSLKDLSPDPEPQEKPAEDAPVEETPQAEEATASEAKSED